MGSRLPETIDSQISSAEQPGSIRVIARAATSIAAFVGRTWRGTIEEIPDSVVNRRLNPQDPSKPIDTRVLLVKIAFSESTPLKLGQRVEVKMDGM